MHYFKVILPKNIKVGMENIFDASAHKVMYTIKFTLLTIALGIVFLCILGFVKKILQFEYEETKRKKAEMVAEAMGKVLVGIDNINVENEYNIRFFNNSDQLDSNFSHALGERHSISNELKAPVCVETETVETVWIVD